MKVRDLMSSPVVSVPPDAPVWQISSTMLEHRISGAPVVDANGSLIGMVSDGDLVGRDETKRQVRWDWWLAAMAGGKDIHPGLLAHSANRMARDIMSAPVITVGEDAEAGEVARLMTTHHVKRLPVVRAGRMCGIVTRTDLQRAVAQEPHADTPAVHEGIVGSVITAIDSLFAAHTAKTTKKPPAPPVRDREDKFDASDFRELVSNFERKKTEEREHAQQAAAKQRQVLVTELINRHITDENWRILIQRARIAAANGEKDFMLVRFPSELCTDGGRSINVSEADWPSTLRGEAAGIYLRWKRDLKPRGFHLSAIILDFPGGRPGDVGLFLVWGD